MNFDRSLIFSYIEEDNIQRAYFRVRPLLTLDGDIRQEAVQLWPNEGGLRIVPDRNEQHTFKVRMRTLGSYCVVDLRNQPAEAGKIRTNKNFRPERGEVNQYILYSDTVHALPENTFYQLMDGAPEDYSVLAQSAVTPLFYIRKEDTLYGPVRKGSPEKPEPAQEAAGVLFEIPCPDQVTRVMLCMDDAPAAEIPAPEKAKEAPKEESEAVAEQADKSVEEKKDEVKEAVEQKADEQLPIGETLKILDESKNHEDTLKQLDKPVSSGANLLHQQSYKPDPVPQSAQKKDALSGTPLVRTPLHVSVQQPKNRTQEIVSSQWSIGKYEPPAQNLPAGANLRSVENPVEAACASLRAAWNGSDSHDQLTDFILSLEGVRPQLETKLCNGKTMTIMQRVLRERLQDLEAERLTALCELDKARRDTDAYKQELVASISAKLNRETSKLEADKKEAEKSLASLKNEINALTIQRDALLGKINELQGDMLPEAAAALLSQMQMTAPVAGIPLRISPASGEMVDADTLVARIIGACSASGIEISRNHAIALLVLLAHSPRIGIACSTPAPAATLIRNIVSAMGWQRSFAHQISAEQHPLVGARPVDAAPAMFMTSLPNYAPITGVAKLMINRSASALIRNSAYDVCQWPVWVMPSLPFVPECESKDAKPVSAASIAAVVENRAASDAELDAVLSPVLKCALPLNGAAKKELYHFVSVCAGLMEGGLPSAVDWGIRLWIIPALERGSRQYNAVKNMLDEYPLSLSML